MNIISNKAMVVVLVVFVFVLSVIIIIQATEIKRERCKIGCEQYKAEDEKGLFAQLEKLVWWFKRNWSLFVIYTASSSLILLFLLAVIFSQEITLVTMNNWVSLILGFTALFMSVASMVLSFYNVEQSHNNELRTTQMDEKIEQKLNNLDSLSQQLLISTNEIQHAREEIKSTREDIKSIREDIKSIGEEIRTFRDETNQKFEDIGLIQTEAGFEEDDSWQMDYTQDEFMEDIWGDWDDDKCNG